MSFLAGFLDSFNQSRQGEHQRNFELERAAGDREFQILNIMAQHPDPEIARMGTTGILQLAGGQAGPTRRHGLRGFMGEVERSPYLPTVDAFFSGGMGTTGQSAALPPGSPIEPWVQRSATPPTLAMTPVSGPQDSPLVRAGAAMAGQQAMEAGMPPGPPALPSLAGPGALPPPPPELPAQRLKRLYPDAGELAYQRVHSELLGKIDAMAQGLQDYPQLEGTIASMMGGQPRSMTPQDGPLIVLPDDPLTPVPTLRHPDGRFTLSDGMTPVPAEAQAWQRPTGSQTGTIARNPDSRTGWGFAMPDGTWRTDTSGQLLEARPSYPPPAFGQIVPGPGGEYYRAPRDSEELVPTGLTAPLPVNQITPEAEEAAAWMTDVQIEVDAVRAARNARIPMSSMKLQALPSAEINAIVQRITQGRFRTWGQLRQASQRRFGQQRRQTGAEAAPDGQGFSREMADRVRRGLDAMQPGGSTPPPPSSGSRRSGLPPGLE